MRSLAEAIEWLLNLACVAVLIPPRVKRETPERSRCTGDGRQPKNNAHTAR